jgi:uncharacterized protein YbjT (DUF2867 family)
MSAMRILVTGAYGLIGIAIVARLRDAGHDVVGVGRDVSEARVRRPDVEWVALDFAAVKGVDDWRPHLAGIDAVVNCVGVLQGSGGASVRDVHVTGTLALFEACAASGIRRVVHLSAIGVPEAQPSEFSRTKLEAETALRALDLDWVVLRPSVVVGRAAFGGSALMRGLAALPVLPVMPHGGDIQVVQLDDVVRTVLFFLRDDAPSRIALDLSGPARFTFPQIVQAYRRWLGWKRQPVVPLPSFIAGLMHRLADAARLLGWRPPLGRSAELEFARGAVGDNSRWRQVTGIDPAGLETALRAEPASVQERWFARLYFLKPLTLCVLALFWIATGLLALGPGYGHGEGLMKEGGVGEPFATLAIVGGGLLDIMIGAGIALRRWSRAALWLSIVTAVAYAVIGTVLVPRLWIDPLGPMLKIWPIIVLTVVAIVTLDDR